MAEFVVGGKVTIDASGAEKSVGSIKQQLREAQKELVAVSEKFGAASAEAVAAAKKVAGFKDAIGDAKALADAFNPDAKFKAFSAALQGVAGGFAAVQGAQALFGAESEDLAKTLAKVQGAMALSQGLNAIGEAGDSFKNLKTVAVDAFNSIKAAIGGTGIGLLVIAVGALAMNWDKITTALGKASEEQKAYNDTLADYRKGAEDAILKVNKVKTAFDLAKSGVISKKEALATYNETLGDSLGKVKSLDEAEKMYAAKAQIYIKVTALKSQANAIFAKAAEESAKTLTVAQDDNTSFWDKAKSVAIGALGNMGGSLLSISNAQIEGTKNAQQEAEKRSKSFQKLGEDLLKQSEELANQNQINNEFEIKENNKKAEKIKKNEVDLTKEIRSIQEENYLSTIKDNDARAIAKIQLDYENKRKEINASKASEEEKQALLKEIEIKASNDIIAINDAKNKKLAEDNKKALDEAQALADENYLHTITNENDRAKAKADLDYQKHIEEVNAMTISEFEKNSLLQQYAIQHQNAITDIEGKAHEDRKKQDEAAFQAKQDNLAAIGGLVGQLAGLVGESTSVGKALTLAQIGIDTAAAISALTRNSEANPANAVTGGVAGAIQFAAGIIKIITNIAKAKQILSQSNAPGMKGSSGGGGSISAPSAPIPPQLQTTTLNQGQIQQMGNAAVRSFVLESDVSGNQERIRRLNRAARIS